MFLVNVAKRSIWDQCKKKYILRTDWRPTSHCGKFQMAISPQGSPIHFMFGSMVRFSRSADWMALFCIGRNSTSMWEKIMHEE